MEKINILSQFIFSFKCDEELRLDCLHKLENEEWSINSSNFRSKDVKLQKNKKYKKLHDWFDECLQSLKKELNFFCDELKITQSWANKAIKSQWHHGHSHPNSIVSGIFYANDSNAKTWFSVPNFWYNSKDEFHKTIRYNDEAVNHIVHKQDTIGGELILFPSSMYHSVDEHADEEKNRYTIAFNTFLSGKVGDFNQLGGMEIKIL